MGIIGIICEYNPLHGGHFRHIASAKKASGADTLICIMSGAFVQRGEPAILDVHTRARWAIQAGADAVILLPTIYSLSSADDFARGGVMAMKEAGIFSAFSFGSMNPDVHALESLAKHLLREPAEFSVAMQEALKSGLGYPAALTRAMEACPPHGMDAKTACSIIKSANDSLGVRYLLENERLCANLTPYVIRRDAEDISASIVRQAVHEGECIPCLDVPHFVAEELMEGNVCDPKFYDNILAAHLRMTSKEQLSTCPDMPQTLCDVLYAAARRYADLQGIILAVSGKNYTHARIRRAIWHSYLGVTEELRNEAKQHFPYLRVLAVKNGRQDILSALAKNAACPVLTDGKTDHLSDFAKSCAALDEKAMDLQAMQLSDPTCGSWYTKRLYIV